MVSRDKGDDCYFTGQRQKFILKTSKDDSFKLFADMHYNKKKRGLMDKVRLVTWSNLEITKLGRWKHSPHGIFLRNMKIYQSTNQAQEPKDANLR